MGDANHPQANIINRNGAMTWCAVLVEFSDKTALVPTSQVSEWRSDPAVVCATVGAGERWKLVGTIIDPLEIDETSIPFRTKDEPVGGGQGRNPIGKLNIIGAVEWRDEGRRRYMCPLYVSSLSSSSSLS